MCRLKTGCSVILISYSPTDDGVIKSARVQEVLPDSVVVDGITFPASLPAWSVPDEGSGGFVRHYLEADTEKSRLKYGLSAA